jgi:polysaccharide pyruvyl transferase WcaK-like protein
MRLHGLVYAAVAGVPVIGLVYDPKVANFIAYVGEETAVETAALDLPRLVGMIDTIVNEPDAARLRICAARDRLRAMSTRDAKVAMQLLKPMGEVLGEVQ